MARPMSPVPAVVVLHIAGAWWRDQYSDQTQLDIGTIPLIGIIIWHLSKHRIIAGHMQGFYTAGNTELNTSMFTIFQKYCLLWVNFVQMYLICIVRCVVAFMIREIATM